VAPFSSQQFEEDAMKRNASGHLLVLALGVFLSVIAAASVGCGKSPTAPGGFDPGQKIDTNNRPPCTIDGKTCMEVTGEEHPLATWEYHLYRQDCGADLSTCDPGKELFPTPDPSLAVENSDQTYVLGTRNWYDKFTVKVCVKHPRVQGRLLLSGASVFGTQDSVGFIEPEKPNVVCYGPTFDMTVPNGVLDEKAISMHFTEQQQDLLEQNAQDANLGLRVLR
jgi:hypothetical protein